MPLYRIARYIVTDAIEVEADSPQEAIALIQKAGVEGKGEFSHTKIEEVSPDVKFSGYVEETTADLIEDAKGR